MASNPVKIGVACPIPGERAAFGEWLNHAGYEPVSIFSIDTIARELPHKPIEALIADVSLVSAADLPRVVRTLGPNRPLILVGHQKDAIEEVPRDASWMERPVSPENFQLSVALALAEGRPARRSPRKLVPKLLASVDGVNSKVVDISSEGVRLEISTSSGTVLPPFFILRVPAFGVAARIKRVWVATPNSMSTWCGGIVEKGAERTAGGGSQWLNFVQSAPSGDIARRNA